MQDAALSIHWLQRLVLRLGMMKHLAQVAHVEILPAYRAMLEMLRLGFIGRPAVINGSGRYRCCCPYGSTGQAESFSASFSRRRITASFGRAKTVIGFTINTDVEFAAGGNINWLLTR